MRHHANAFTLIELLVVVTIIVVLLALLTPALDQAIMSGERARCGANEHQIGLALQMYLLDYKGRYPAAGWGDIFGSKGGWTNKDVTGKPLNAYLGYRTDGSPVPVAYCPSDQGDASGPFWPVWGMSYLETNTANRARTDFVFAPDNTSKRQTSLRPVHTKVIIGDWVWHANSDMARRWWHAPEGMKLYNMLFGDGHAAFIDLDDHPLGPQTIADNNIGGNRSAPYW
jgi:prepilin-type N-terminal cleavage/methylation domain-containing protein/prepilin-type processing-associated H-X9-DG protein